jgi:hypothetical protein
MGTELFQRLPVFLLHKPAGGIVPELFQLVESRRSNSSWCFLPGLLGDRDGELVYQFGFGNNATNDASDFDLISRMR